MSTTAYFCGGLSLDDQARVLNWIYTKFPKHNPVNLELAAAHARTLLLAYRHHNEFLETHSDSDNDHLTEWQCILKRAWDRLHDYTGKTIDGKIKQEGVDVDYEAVSILEEVMFDRTESAGAAGNCQWGLDVGPLEDGWFPYNGPEAQGENLRDGTESELECGPDYQPSTLIQPKENVLKPPRPKPRPIIPKRRLEEVKNSEDSRRKRRKTSRK
ncbi:hypothetical protein VKT23_009223 [Stygiomarasmius scandens]|uniref:Uncharacterized protein n=1 Tax=Marasmiellus scandens TaxID=2682957 RepID=A0ABR1JIX9_9AGAR